MTINERLRSLRGSMTRRDFSQLTGINQSTLYEYEKGRCHPSFKNLNKIAMNLGVHNEWLLHGTGEKYAASPKSLVVQHNNHTIAERIRELRGFMSRREFAQLIEIKEQTIYDYEKGRSKPSIKVIGKITEKFGVTSEWLLYGTGEKYAASPKSLVVQHNNHSNAVGITMGDSPFDGAKKSTPAKTDAPCASCEAYVERIKTLEEQNKSLTEALMNLQKEYVEMAKMLVRHQSKPFDGQSS